MKYCVQCGQQNIPDDAFVYRCRPCWEAYQAAGAKTVRTTTMTEWAGMRVASITYKNHALYCRNDGKPLGMTRRVRFALERGGEVLTCDACAWKKKNAPPPSPSTNGLPK